MNVILSHLLFPAGQRGPVYESGKKGIPQIPYQTEWKKLHKKPYTIFTEEFRSNWEKQTDMLWREWGD